jgi:hypothetical protein
MDLLSQEDRDKIRLALKDVTDTFMKTPVIYSVYGDTLDRFSEDRKNKKESVYNLYALAEYRDDTGEWGKGMPAGLKDQANIKLTFNLEDLVEEGLVETVNWTHKFSIGSDFFITQAKKYKLVWAGYDGPLDQKNILVVLYGEIRNN